MPFAVTAALAVMGAVDAKVVTALTVRVWLAEVPRTVLPAAVRVAAVLVRVTPPVKVARPALSMVRRSTGCPLLLLVLPAVVVLNIKLPPVYPAASYSKCNILATVGCATHYMRTTLSGMQCYKQNRAAAQFVTQPQPWAESDTWTGVPVAAHGCMLTVNTQRISAVVPSTEPS